MDVSDLARKGPPMHCFVRTGMILKVQLRFPERSNLKAGGALVQVSYLMTGKAVRGELSDTMVAWPV